MIKSIQIRSLASIYAMPKINEEIEQHLTISASDRVWLTRYGFSLSSDHSLIKREYARMSKESAGTLFAYIEEYLRHPDDLYACDTGAWTLTIRYDDRPAYRISRPMLDQVYVGDVNVSNWIRNHIPLEGLMAFGEDDDASE